MEASIERCTLHGFELLWFDVFWGAGLVCCALNSMLACMFGLACFG